MTLEALVLMAVALAAVCRLYVWIRDAIPGPEPWSADVQNQIENAEVPGLCPHCLTPQDHYGWFCPECGATVTPYSSLLPAVYPFAIGEAVRSGVNGRIQRSALVVTGYTLLALAHFSLLAPFYLYFLFKRLNWSQSTPDPDLPNNRPDQSSSEP
jgi:hypothetical protein